MTDVKTEVVLYEVADGIATLTLNRPDRLNAWTGGLAKRYYSLLEHGSYSQLDYLSITQCRAGGPSCDFDREDFELARPIAVYILPKGYDYVAIGSGEVIGGIDRCIKGRRFLIVAGRALRLCRIRRDEYSQG